MPTPSPDVPRLESALQNLTVSDLKWYAGALAAKLPTRKGELVSLLLSLLQPARLRQLWSQLSPERQHLVGEVVYNLDGRYNGELLRAKYPNVPAPQGPPNSYYGYFDHQSAGKQPTAFDLFFYRSADLGVFIPFDLAALLRAFVPQPPRARMRSHDAMPGLPVKSRFVGYEPEVLVSQTERAAFHDLSAALQLVQQGKAAVSPATHLPTLGTTRQLRQRLLIGDYFDDDYERAEDAIRPLALIMLVQAAKWAAPGTGNKLELTRRGQALLGTALGPQPIREAWQSWVKNSLIDELSRSVRSAASRPRAPA